jgi:putative phage-type endonuclease
MLEPKARAAYVHQTGVQVNTACVEHDVHSWMKASLDGISADGSLVLEIKCPGHADHAVALSGRVPDKYLPQLQHLLAVTGALRCDYWSFDGSRGVLIEVWPDPGYFELLFRREAAFWKCVTDGTRP